MYNSTNAFDIYPRFKWNVNQDGRFSYLPEIREECRITIYIRAVDNHTVSQRTPKTNFIFLKYLYQAKNVTGHVYVC